MKMTKIVTAAAKVRKPRFMSVRGFMLRQARMSCKGWLSPVAVIPEAVWGDHPMLRCRKAAWEPLPDPP